ncbi:hypothetical protein [Anaerostipes sp.]|uniref:hypothetical protein n=1 Tax=Anaerostipes sp. TaxID=1872530 RepID=UPI0025BEEBCF|nr:hypothetical protein [Anaerostipes sp.]MBS7008030.1 hypothetical protein [Anaerostipes sp.]
MQKVSILRNIVLLIVLCCIFQGCVKKDNKEGHKIQISQKEVQVLIKDAEKRLETGMNESLKEVKYDPEYYKKIRYKTREEFIKDMLSETFKKNYTTDRIIILQAYYKDTGEIDSMIYGKDPKTGKWKYLQRFR